MQSIIKRTIKTILLQNFSQTFNFIFCAIYYQTQRVIKFSKVTVITYRIFIPSRLKNNDVG